MIHLRLLEDLRQLRVIVFAVLHRNRRVLTRRLGERVAVLVDEQRERDLGLVLFRRPGRAARALLRHLFHNEVDLLPDSRTNTLTVQLHHLTHATHDRPVAELCAALNETQTVFPGTNLTLIFKIGSSEIHRDQDV